MYGYMRRLWGRWSSGEKHLCNQLDCKQNDMSRMLVGQWHNTQRYVVFHHKHLRKASSSLQGDAQLTLAYDMMHDSPGETMTSYDEHVGCTFSSKIIRSHCVNMGDSDFDSFWRATE